MINENYISDGLTETLPDGLINLGDDNHVANMANFSMYVNAKQAVSGNNPTDKSKIGLLQDSLDRFGNWTGQTSTLEMAKDLKRRGLEGAQQLIDDTAKVNVNDPNSIRNSQSDWKVSAIQQIVSNAKRYNLRTKAEVMVNKDLLVTKKEWKDAINNDSFKTIHGNFWEIITDKILPQQWEKYETNSIVKK